MTKIRVNGLVHAVLWEAWWGSDTACRVTYVWENWGEVRPIGNRVDHDETIDCMACLAMGKTGQ